MTTATTTQLQNLTAAASARVISTPELREYENIICADWSEGAEHSAWIETAPVSEIVQWAKDIRRDELSLHN